MVRGCTPTGAADDRLCAQVRFARSRVFIPAGSGPEDNRQLFFSRAAACASESDIVALFNRWGLAPGPNRG
jgi:hypothetical protein